MYCQHCGTTLSENDNFCVSCGGQIAVSPLPAPAKPHLPGTTAISTGQAGNAMMQLVGSVIAAPPGAGEVAFAGGLPQTAEGTMQAPNPLKVLFSGALNVVRGVGAAFKDKKKWIPALILATVWFVLTLLPIMGINPKLVRVLSWLTFAQGGIGMFAKPGVMQIAGGLIGKGVVAGFLLSLFSGGTLKSMGSGLKLMFSSLACKGKEEIGMLLCGAGVALICYNFMAGLASLSLSMVGVSAFLLSLRAIGRSTGFLRSFFGGLTAQKTEKGKVIDVSATNRVIAGIAAGFGLSVPLSALYMFFLPYMLGMLFIIAGQVLCITGKTKKEARAI